MDERAKDNHAQDEHVQDQAALYVLGLLSPEEARKFEDAMERDPELLALVGRMETGAAAFALTAPVKTPPAALGARILDRVKQGPALENVVVPMPGRGTWIPWAIAACLALCTAWLGYQRYHLRLLVDSFVIRTHLQQAELDHVHTREAALQTRLDSALANTLATVKLNADLQAQLKSLRGQVAELASRDALSQVRIAALASLVKGNPQGIGAVAWDNSSQRGILKTAGMPAPRANQDYQLWIIDPDYKAPVSAGVFDPAKGSTFAPDHPIQKADKFAVSLEKKGGSPAPQGPIVLVGE